MKENSRKSKDTYPRSRPWLAPPWPSWTRCRSPSRRSCRRRPDQPAPFNLFRPSSNWFWCSRRSQQPISSHRISRKLSVNRCTHVRRIYHGFAFNFLRFWRPEIPALGVTIYSSYLGVVCVFADDHFRKRKWQFKRKMALIFRGSLRWFLRRLFPKKFFSRCSGTDGTWNST